ncbi:MAG TPA: pyrroline-5-carboxylate reductase [Nitrospirota bacterium]|nr:pyrroline-5-carboxylate reductase [Nitrospirota bacterium]
MDKKVAFIGAGNMAEAMVKGLVTSGLVPKEAVTVSDASAHRLLHMKKTYGVGALTDNAKAARGKDVVVLAVKPKDMAHVLKEIAPSVTAKQLVISIAAGVTTARIGELLGKKARVVRVMPNTPALVQEGAAALFAGPGAKEGDTELAVLLLSAICKVVVTAADEKLMDAVTGLSGSGPAYMFVMLEALSDAGVRMGLPREDAFMLAAQTMIGSAKMALTTREPLSKLKDMVTSPGGTTIAGLHKLEDGGVRAALYAAVEAATKRSQELGK